MRKLLYSLLASAFIMLALPVLADTIQTYDVQEAMPFYDCFAMPCDLISHQVITTGGDDDFYDVAIRAGEDASHIRYEPERPSNDGFINSKYVTLTTALVLPYEVGWRIV